MEGELVDAGTVIFAEPALAILYVYILEREAEGLKTQGDELVEIMPPSFAQFVRHDG